MSDAADPEWERICAMTDNELDDELRMLGVDPVQVAVDAERFVDRIARLLAKQGSRS